MSVSMLLNAANVVTAAERCKAIDEKTGRIPINFLLSRSTDLDDHVKDQLQQLAETSSTISILPDRDPGCHDGQPSAHVDDAVMMDVTHSQTQQLQYDHESEADAMEGDDEESEDDEPDDTESHLAMLDDHEVERSTRSHLVRNEEEEEALKDIYRDNGRRERNIMRRTQKKNQTLTRKAIRKHTVGTNGCKKGNAKDNKAAMDSSSSTMNTVAGSDTMQSSVASSASQHSNTPRRRWKEWEDELLIRVVAEHGPTRWNNLARHFPGRNGRQVRLRWMNHLQPSLDKRPWRPEEDAVLLEAHKALGNKWALISMRLGGRTDNSVKNRYKSIVRRHAREAKAARKQE